MSVELNHTIIPAKDKWVSAKFLADILNLEAGPEWGHFVPVKTANGVTLDFDTREEFRPGHYAFLVSPFVLRRDDRVIEFDTHLVLPSRFVGMGEEVLVGSDRSVILGSGSQKTQRRRGESRANSSRENRSI